MSQHDFKFALDEMVMTPHFTEPPPRNAMRIPGEVLSRAQHNDGRRDSYLVRYTDHNGCEVENWFAEDRLG